MSTPVIINGVTYHIPAYNETGWSQGSGNLSSFLVAVGTIASARRLDGTNSTSYVASSSKVASPATTQYFDVTSVALTAGTWSVSGMVGLTFQSTSSITLAYGAIGSLAGNSSSDLVLGNNLFSQTPPTATIDTTVSIPGFIVALSVSASVYLKARMDFTGSSPASYGRITAVQIG